jgi:hypothetical protein
VKDIPGTELQIELHLPRRMPLVGGPMNESKELFKEGLSYDELPNVY